MISKVSKVYSELIYYFFRNKEDLYRKAIEFAIRQALDNFARLRERHNDPVDLINDWLETNIQPSTPIRKLVKVMLDHSTAPVRLRSVEALIRKFYKEGDKHPFGQRAHRDRAWTLSSSGRQAHGPVCLDPS
jgi:AcrR family transcriptional regulator